MKDIRSVWNTIGRHCKILLKGLLRVVYGAATAGMVALAVYGFVMISGEEGWVAVCDFIASMAAAVVALTCMYTQGLARKRGAWL